MLVNGLRFTRYLLLSQRLLAHTFFLNFFHNISWVPRKRIKNWTVPGHWFPFRSWSKGFKFAKSFESLQLNAVARRVGWTRILISRRGKVKQPSISPYSFLFSKLFHKYLYEGEKNLREPLPVIHPVEFMNVKQKTASKAYETLPSNFFSTILSIDFTQKQRYEESNSSTNCSAR